MSVFSDPAVQLVVMLVIVMATLGSGGALVKAGSITVNL